MPFSNQKLEGFENRIADLIAKDFGATPTYIWWGQRRGFIRNTMNATLEAGRCDVVIGVPEKYDLVRTTTALLSVDVRVRLSERQGAGDQVSRRSGAQEAEDRRAPARRRLHESAAGPRAVEAGHRRQRRRVQHVLLRATIRRARSSMPWRADASTSPSSGVRWPDTLPRASACRWSGADPVRQGRPAVRLRHLDGRQAGNDALCERAGAGARPGGRRRSRRS